MCRTSVGFAEFGFLTALETELEFEYLTNSLEIRTFLLFKQNLQHYYLFFFPFKAETHFK